MLYLDDIVYDIKNQRYQRLRSAVCIILSVLLAVKVFSIIGTFMAQKNNIEKNRISIAEYENEIAILQQNVKEYESHEVTEYYDVTEIGDKVAAVQSEYGGFKENEDLSYITESSRKTAAEMDQYIRDGDGRTAWYQNMTCNYQWYFIMRQTSVIADVPCIWECKSDTNTVLAITTADYDGTNDQFDNFKTYYTSKGQALISENTKINVSGVVESDVDYEDYYEKIMGIQSTVSQNAGSDTSCDGTDACAGTTTQSISIDGNITVTEAGEQ